ncbi:MAG: hypothetical protein A2V70_11485 [Planctomycetes bacterium RBG_13_63_9]|nr:MAG: hypothetical protein A2V70_11485 [Planctomycetes bacterium RBG_13_63_9]
MACCLGTVCVGCCAPVIRPGRAQANTPFCPIVICNQCWRFVPCDPRRPCDPGGPCDPGCSRVSSVKRLLASEAEIPVGYHSHPRFFPVPTRPAFAPGLYPTPGAFPGMAPPEPLPPDDGPQPIRIDLPSVVPEEIRRPRPERTDAPASPPKGEDRVTSAPQRTDSASQPPGWISGQPAVGEPDGDIDTLPKSEARWIRR